MNDATNAKHVIMLYGEKVLCIGNYRSCVKYINQLYDTKLENVTILNYDKDHYLYEDYHIIAIRGYDFYFTQGEIKMMTDSCKEEQSSVKFIQDELDKLIDSTIFSDETRNEMIEMKNKLDMVKREHVKYLNENLFTNLDFDALRHAHNQERENKGLPTIYVI